MGHFPVAPPPGVAHLSDAFGAELVAWPPAPVAASGRLMATAVLPQRTDVAVTGYVLDLRLDYNPRVGTAPIPKRNLRVTKWLGTIPAVGVCTFCDRLFYVPLTALKRVADAQESLRVQFTEHKCKTQTGS